jgi:hypothetical protein
VSIRWYPEDMTGTPLWLEVIEATPRGLLAFLCGLAFVIAVLLVGP